MFAFCFFVFFSENTRKRSNILFFSGVKVSEQKKSIFLVEKNCTRKKRKNPPEESEFFFFFFFLRLSCKTFSFFFHVCFAIRIFPSCFFSPSVKTVTQKKQEEEEEDQTNNIFFHAWNRKHKFSQMKKKTTSVINKICLKTFVSLSERETNIYFSLNMKLRIN